MARPQFKREHSGYQLATPKTIEAQLSALGFVERLARTGGGGRSERQR
jgi:hypothetical protein